MADRARHLEHDWWSGELPTNVRLGDRSWLHSSFAFLHYASRRPCGVSVGDDTGVYIGTMFDVGPEGEVHIGRFGAIAGPIFSTNSRIVIGDYALISWDVVFADSAAALPPACRWNPSGPTPPRSSGRDIVVGDNVWIGARAVVLGGAEIGDGSIVGACTVVDGPVAPYSVVAGNPVRTVGRLTPGG